MEMFNKGEDAQKASLCKQKKTIENVEYYW